MLKISAPHNQRRSRSTDLGVCGITSPLLFAPLSLSDSPPFCHLIPRSSLSAPAPSSKGLSLSASLYKAKRALSSPSCATCTQMINKWLRHVMYWSSPSPSRRTDGRRDFKRSQSCGHTTVFMYTTVSHGRYTLHYMFCTILSCVILYYLVLYCTLLSCTVNEEKAHPYANNFDLSLVCFCTSWPFFKCLHVCALCA